MYFWVSASNLRLFLFCFPVRYCEGYVGVFFVGNDKATKLHVVLSSLGLTSVPPFDLLGLLDD